MNTHRKIALNLKIIKIQEKLEKIKVKKQDYYNKIDELSFLENNLSCELRELKS